MFITRVIILTLATLASHLESLSLDEVHSSLRSFKNSGSGNKADKDTTNVLETARRRREEYRNAFNFPHQNLFSDVIDRRRKIPILKRQEERVVEVPVDEINYINNGDLTAEDAPTTRNNLFSLTLAGKLQRLLREIDADDNNRDDYYSDDDTYLDDDSRFASRQMKKRSVLLAKKRKREALISKARRAVTRRSALKTKVPQSLSYESGIEHHSLYWDPSIADMKAAFAYKKRLDPRKKRKAVPKHLLDKRLSSNKLTTTTKPKVNNRQASSTPTVKRYDTRQTTSQQQGNHTPEVTKVSKKNNIQNVDKHNSIIVANAIKKQIVKKTKPLPYQKASHKAVLIANKNASSRKQFALAKKSAIKKNLKKKVKKIPVDMKHRRKRELFLSDNDYDENNDNEENENYPQIDDNDLLEKQEPPQPEFDLDTWLQKEYYKNLAKSLAMRRKRSLEYLEEEDDDNNDGSKDEEQEIENIVDENMIPVDVSDEDEREPSSNITDNEITNEKVDNKESESEKESEDDSDFFINKIEDENEFDINSIDKSNNEYDDGEQAEKRKRKKKRSVPLEFTDFDDDSSVLDEANLNNNMNLYGFENEEGEKFSEVDEKLQTIQEALIGEALDIIRTNSDRRPTSRSSSDKEKITNRLEAASELENVRLSLKDLHHTVEKMEHEDDANNRGDIDYILMI